MAHYLYMEVSGIQRFVFAAQKLKMIRGGSALLDIFNRVDMKAEASRVGGNVVVAGAGHCLVGGLTMESADGLGLELSRTLARRTDGQVTLARGIAADDGSWDTVWRCLHEDLAKRALNVPYAAAPLPPFVALCSSCGVSPARELVDMKERRLEPLCKACRERLNQADQVNQLYRETVWDRLRQHLRRFDEAPTPETFKKLLPEREFEDLAALGRQAGYLAYVYCDGNGMGKRLAALGSAEDYGNMSRTVDEALHAAVAAAITKYCAPENSNGKFGAEVLLLGGDDLIVALPADRGASFVCEVLRVFHQRTNEELRLSAGLVFAPYTTPIAILQHVATSLLRSAKRYAYLDEMRTRLGRRDITVDNGEPPRKIAAGYIDFQELTSAQSEVERRFAVTSRPYRIDDFEELVRRTSALHTAKVPKGRIHALVEAVHGSQREALTTSQMIVARARNDEQRRVLLELLRPLHASDKRMSARPYTVYPDSAWDLPFELYLDDEAEPHRFSLIPDAHELLEHVDSDGAAL